MKTNRIPWAGLPAMIACILLAAPLAAQEDTRPIDREIEAAEIATPSDETTDSTLEEREAAVTTTETSPRRSRRTQRDAVVMIGKDVELKSDEAADVVVVIGGSARIRGRVQDPVVAVGGDIFLEKGADVGQAIAILGKVHAAAGSEIRHDAVAVGGGVEIDEGANLRGSIQDIDFGGFVFPETEWLRDWFRHCVLMLRPLAPQVGWIWMIAGAIFLIYFLIAGLFARPIEVCVDELTRRPATTFLIGILTKLLVPMLVVLLAFTGVGLLVVPFIVAALFLAAIVGKVAILQWIGLRLGRPFEIPVLQNPLIALLIGGVLIALLYMVPVVGLLTFMVTSVWGIGAAITGAFGGLRREIPPGRMSSAVPQANRAGPSAAAGNFVLDPNLYANVPGYAPADPSPLSEQPGVAGVSEPAGTGFAPLPTTPPVLPDTLVYPKAGFWERLGAGFIDAVLLIVIASIVDGPAPLIFLIGLAYFSGMWAWRGTSIGGVVVGLKVLRYDGKPTTFPVALVRGLAGAFSVVALGIGFLWIAWDSEKQGWHDKIAGTVVLRTPRSGPLVCL